MTSLNRMKLLAVGLLLSVAFYRDVPRSHSWERSPSEISLPHRLRLYIPGTNAGEVDLQAQACWKRRVQHRFTAWFGGSTTYVAQGTWLTDDGIIDEPIVIVESFARETDLATSWNATQELCRELGEALQQECIALERDGVLMLISIPPDSAAQAPAPLHPAATLP